MGDYRGYMVIAERSGCRPGAIRSCRVISEPIYSNHHAWSSPASKFGCRLGTIVRSSVVPFSSAKIEVLAIALRSFSMIQHRLQAGCFKAKRATQHPKCENCMQAASLKNMNFLLLQVQIRSSIPSRLSTFRPPMPYKQTPSKEYTSIKE